VLHGQHSALVGREAMCSQRDWSCPGHVAIMDLISTSIEPQFLTMCNACSSVAMAQSGMSRSPKVTTDYSRRFALDGIKMKAHWQDHGRRSSGLVDVR
jgi:hypothetical protein